VSKLQHYGHVLPHPIPAVSRHLVPMKCYWHILLYYLFVWVCKTIFLGHIFLFAIYHMCGKQIWKTAKFKGPPIQEFSECQIASVCNPAKLNKNKNCSNQLYPTADTFISNHCRSTRYLYLIQRRQNSLCQGHTLSSNASAPEDSLCYDGWEFASAELLPWVLVRISSAKVCLGPCIRTFAVCSVQV
jgi:hypothetical protein